MKKTDPIKKCMLLDLETTGLNPEIHEIIEIGWVTFNWITLEMLGSAEYKIQPQQIERADPKALEINGYTPKKWENAIPLKRGLTRLTHEAARGIIGGYNFTFDWSFLYKGFWNWGVDVETVMSYHRLDVMSMAHIVAGPGRNSDKELGLTAMCDFFGIEPVGKKHTALGDTLTTFALYKRLRKHWYLRQHEPGY